MLTANERTALVDGIVANCECWGKEDVDVLNVFDDSKLQKLHAHALKEKAGVTSNAAPVVVPETTVNAADPSKKQTAEEWFAAAPPEIQSAVRNAMQIEADGKEKFVSKLITNVAAANKDAVAAVLRAKSMDELKMLASLIPEAPAVVGNAFGVVRPSYSGASGGPALTANAGAYDKNDVLTMPRLDWAALSDENMSYSKKSQVASA